MRCFGRGRTRLLFPFEFFCVTFVALKACELLFTLRRQNVWSEIFGMMQKEADYGHGHKFVI
jgi:hypothetical protein